MKDSYLDNLVTTEHTAQATNYIESVYPQIVDTYFKQRLIDLNTYLVTCSDMQMEDGDIFQIKYKQYKTQFDETIKTALNSIKTTAGISTLTISMERA